MRNGLKCQLLFKNPVCWKVFNLLFALSPPSFESFAKCKRSLCLSAFPAPPFWEALMLLPPGAEIGTVKGWGGRKPTQQPAVLSRLPLEPGRPCRGV